MIIKNDFSWSLLEFKKIEIPRCVRTVQKFDIIEIQGFAGASKRAYTPLIYFRIIVNKIPHGSLVWAKTGVVPLKSLSIVRLEICAALLLINLFTTVKQSLSNINFNQVRLWYDSQIALCWIKSPHHRWLPFVGNLVKKIQDQSENAV